MKTLVDYIQEAGDRLQCNRLDTNFLNYKRKKHGCEITFGTSDEMGQDLSRQVLGVTKKRKYVGIVVWIPADLVDDAAKEGAHHG